MTKKFSLLILTPTFSLCFTTAIFAQQFIVNGVVFDKQTRNRIALAEIKNKKTGFSVGSNDLGFFSLKVSFGDTLQITKRNFNDQDVLVASNKDLLVYLNRGTTLNEVVITGYSKKQALDEIRKEFKNKGSFYSGKPPLKLLNPFGGSPLTSLYELFGKTPARARRFSRMYENELRDSQVDALYNKSTINANTGLTGKQLEDFLVKYRPEYTTTKNWTVYDATKWIKDNYKKYSDSLKIIK